MLNHRNVRHTYGIRRLEWEEVGVGVRVRRGPDWNSKKWRDDVDTLGEPDWSGTKPKVGGSVVGFIDEGGMLVGRDSTAKYCIDRLSVTGWAAVRWDNGKESVYPVGFENVFSLARE